MTSEPGSDRPTEAVAPRTPAEPHSEKTATFRVLAGTIVPLMNLISKITIRNAEKVPKTGAFVLAPNHFSEIDPLVIGIAMWRVGRMPRYLAKASLFTVPVLGTLMRKSGQVPVQRTGAPRGGIDPIAEARRIVNDGLAVVIYPEGSLTRDPDLWPMRGKTGAVRTALEQDIPVIPAAHWGTQKVLPRYGKLSLFPRKKVTVMFGDEVDLDRFRGKGLDTALLVEATSVVMDAITALLAELRGESAPAQRWDPARNNQSETGHFEQS